MEYIVKLGTIHHRRASPQNALARPPETVIRAGESLDPAAIGMDDATVQHMLRTGMIALPEDPAAPQERQMLTTQERPSVIVTGRNAPGYSQQSQRPGEKS
jgi:hypothetical protein